MKRELTCIICPRGCALTAEIENGTVTVTGNNCPKGSEYATEECTHPTRTVTSAIRVANRPDTMVSVKTAALVPKDRIFEVMKQIRSVTVSAPVNMGDILVPGICGTDIIATKSIR